MADKITGYGRANVDVSTTRTRALGRSERPVDSGSTGRASSAADAVDITDTAAKLKSIESRLAEVPDVDQARVAAVRERIKSGNYQPDPARIAQKLMRLERELG